MGKSKGANGVKKTIKKAETTKGLMTSMKLDNWLIVTMILAGMFGWLHSSHIWTLFESDRHFSHLSSLERDLAFRTEMGLYYSYYQTIIEAPSAMDGLHQIVFDNVTEFPATINVLKRFNLWPELVVGVAYRTLASVAKMCDVKLKECWNINRGDTMPPAVSCVGIGDPHHFYVHSVYLFNGVMMSVVFLYGWYLSGCTIMGGLICVAFYFFNHTEATRVMWTPPLRESFSFPFLIAELLAVTCMIKAEKPTYKTHVLSISVSAFLFMLPWQFAQFALLTQTACVFALYILEFIGSWKMNILLHGQIFALLANFAFQCGNEMLLTSFYASSLLAVFIVVKLEGKIEPAVRNLIARCLVKGFLWLFCTFVAKKTIAAALQIADDAHIWEIFLSKFTDFQNFHTMLYTCAREFDFIEGKTLLKLFKTTLIPSCVVIALTVAVKCLNYEYQAYQASRSKAESDKDVSKVRKYNAELEAHRSKPCAEYVYTVLQTVAFTCMALLIMRLKLFMTPMMCICSSLLANRKLFGFLGSQSRQTVMVCAVLGISAIAGIGNLVEQMNILGEFSNWPHEQILTHISEQLPEDAVFAGAMPTMASIKLSCKRAIVNHPHYEDAGLRERTKQVYSMYSRKTLEQVRDIVQDMGVTHYILENSWCVRKTRDGCQMPEIFDIEEPELAGGIPACAVARNNPEPYFTEVYKNDVYTILQLNKREKKL